MKKEIISPIDQLWYGVFSFVLLSILSALSFALLISSQFPGDNTILVILGIALFSGQIILSAKRFKSIGVTPYYSFLHLFIPITPFLVLYLIVRRPLEKSEEVNSENKIVQIKEESKSNFSLRQYYIWLFAIYFLLFPFFKTKFATYLQKTPNQLSFFDTLYVILAALFIIFSCFGIYLLIKRFIKNKENSNSFKIISLILCLIIIYFQGSFVYERVFSDRAVAYRNAVESYSMPQKVIGVTDQSIIIESGQQIFFKYRGNPAPAKFAEIKQDLVGKEVVIKIPSFNAWKGDYGYSSCGGNCQPFYFIYYNDELLNTKYGFYDQIMPNFSN